MSRSCEPLVEVEAGLASQKIGNLRRSLSQAYQESIPLAYYMEIKYSIIYILCNICNIFIYIHNIDSVAMLEIL